MPFGVTWMDLEIAILIEVGQTEEIKYHMIIVHMSYCLYVEFKKMVLRNLFAKQKLSHRHKKTSLRVPRGKWGEG